MVLAPTKLTHTVELSSPRPCNSSSTKTVTAEEVRERAGVWLSWSCSSLQCGILSFASWPVKNGFQICPRNFILRTLTGFQCHKKQRPAVGYLAGRYYDEVATVRCGEYAADLSLQ
jgi:hypothetical protein